MAASSASQGTGIVELLGRLLELARTWTSTDVNDLWYYLK